MINKMDKLPLNYDYISVSVPDNKCKSFRIKDVNNKESVEVWVNKYSEETKITWRKKRTFPNCGKFNIYKIEYRCCHNTDRRAKGIGPSKHTGCHAKLVITINKFIENSKSKADSMQLIKSHPCLVMLYDDHNHDFSTSETLKYRDLSPEVKEQLVQLFYKGHNPASALKTYKAGLMSDLGDRYCEAAADGMIMPSYSVVHKLYGKVFSKSCEGVSQGETERHLKYLDQYAKDNQGVAPSIVGSFSNGNEVRTANEILPFASDDDVNEVCERLTEFCNKIKEKVRGNREIFLPAAKKMLATSDKLIDSGLLTAMYTFGNCSGRKQKVSKRILQRSRKTAIGGKPTAIARRKGCLPGKKKISAGKPHGQTTSAPQVCHAYNTFGCSPNTKNDASHELQTCIWVMPNM